MGKANTVTHMQGAFNPAITYLYEEKHGVYLDGRKVGEIRRIPGGYGYYPKGKKECGEVYRELNACKRSIEKP